MALTEGSWRLASILLTDTLMRMTPKLGGGKSVSERRYSIAIRSEADTVQTLQDSDTFVSIHRSITTSR